MFAKGLYGFFDDSESKLGKILLKYRKFFLADLLLHFMQLEFVQIHFSFSNLRAYWDKAPA